MTIGERIKELRKAKGMGQVALADKINVSKQNLYKYENGIITNIPSDKIEAIASALGVTPAYLMGWSDITTSIPDLPNIHPIETRSVPWLGEISCGVPKFADQDFLGYVKVGADIQCDFCLTCRGDSMINARINDGDIVFIKQQSIVENGEIAAVAVDDEALLKRVYYYRDKNLMILKAENSKYEDLVYSGKEIDDITILGKAIFFQSDITHLSNIN